MMPLQPACSDPVAWPLRGALPWAAVGTTRGPASEACMTRVCVVVQELGGNATMLFYQSEEGSEVGAPLPPPRMRVAVIAHLRRPGPAPG
jgi:hypothetical protein